MSTAMIQQSQQTSPMLRQTSQTSPMIQPAGSARWPAPKTSGFPALSRRTDMVALIRENGPSGRVRLALLGIPVPRGRQALVRIALSYVCPANDLAPRSNPGSLGHQAVGIVCAVGSQVERVSVGERVIVDLPFADPAADANAGEARHDDRIGNLPIPSGTHAEYTLVGDADGTLIPLPASISSEAALLAGDVGIAGLRLATAAVRPGDRVLVYSARPNGLATAMMARALGAASITVVDTDAGRLERARLLVADHTLVYRRGELQYAMRGLGGPADVVLNAIAGSKITDEHLACLRPGGTLAFLESHCGGHRSLPFWAAVGEALVVSAPALPRPKAMVTLLDLIAAGRVQLQSLLGRPLPLAWAQNLLNSKSSSEDDGLACAISAGERDTVSRLGW